MELRPTAVEFKHNQLFAGEVDYIVSLKASAGTYKRGMLLETADGITYAPATEIVIGKHYAMCGEDVTVEAGDTVVSYKHGYFNKRVVEEATGEGIVTENAVEILKTKDIFLVETTEQ